mmetsp:Transcript_87977/g.257174  ORF Transcript_87977/g.257174 Transcript_87977/m.257174 type:complete len:215 (+) Transcript_87977:173-817(+)
MLLEERHVNHGSATLAYPDFWIPVDQRRALRAAGLPANGPGGLQGRQHVPEGLEIAVLVLAEDLLVRGRLEVPLESMLVRGPRREVELLHIRALADACLSVHRNDAQDVGHEADLLLVRSVKLADDVHGGSRGAGEVFVPALLPLVDVPHVADEAGGLHVPGAGHVGAEAQRHAGPAPEEGRGEGVDLHIPREDRIEGHLEDAGEKLPHSSEQE